MAHTLVHTCMVPRTNCNYFDFPKVHISFRLTLRFYDHIADMQTNNSGISLGLTFCLMLINKS